MSGPQLFTWFHHDARPLSQWLHDHVRRTVAQLLAAATSVTALDELVGRLEELIDEHMPDLLTLNGVGEPLRTDGPSRPGQSAGTSSFTLRQLFPVQIQGTVELLEWWPDKVDVTLNPVGLRLEDEPTFEERRSLTLPPPSVDDTSPAFAEFSRDTFLLTPAFNRKGERGPRLWISIDTTAEERRVHRGSGQYARAVEARVEYLTEMVRCINEQVGAYRDQLAEELRVAVGVRRGVLEDEESLIETLSFASEWRRPPPTLEADPLGEEALRSVSDIVDTDDRGPVAVLDAPIGQRLSAASFNDVQLIIAGWARGVHDYARVFHSLDEDSLSCLLTATLKATTPGADHQVYRRAGRTDIVIRANDLPDGRSNEPVFVCEAKKGGAGLAARALEEQLLSRYTTVQDTAAVLLLYLTNTNFTRARNTALSHIRRVEGYERDDAGEAVETVAGWPVLAFRRRGRLIRVCVATVDLHYREPVTGTKTPARRASAEKAPSRGS